MKSKRKKIIYIVIILTIIIISGIGGKIYVDKQKEIQYYQQGFKMLESQIAYYIRDNYSGIKEIEFSPIYKDGDGRFSMLTMDIVPIITDEYGNKTILTYGDGLSGSNYNTYGLGYGVPFVIDFHHGGLDDGRGYRHLIWLYDVKGNEIDVTEAKELPEEAKPVQEEAMAIYGKSFLLDDSMEFLIKSERIKGIKKGKSPNAKITYNLEIREGIITKDYELLKKQKLAENEEKYGEEIREKYGEETIKASNEKYSKMTEEEVKELEALHQKIVNLLNEAFLEKAEGGVEFFRDASLRYYANQVC